MGWQVVELECADWLGEQLGWLVINSHFPA